jgi:hypothetical protein
MNLNERDRLRYSNVGALGGFNTGDYGGDRKARNSVKNTFGRIASRYASQPNSLDAVMQDADFRAAFPNARKVGHDKIDFGGVQSDFESGTPVGVIDVLEASDPATNTAKRWQWGVETGDANPQATASGWPDQNTESQAPQRFMTLAMLAKTPSWMQMPAWMQSQSSPYRPNTPSPGPDYVAVYNPWLRASYWVHKSDPAATGKVQM